jgi:cadmium resistance protein CadD (predicted permease)
MEELYTLLSLVLKGVDNPILAGIGGLIMLILGIAYKVMKDKMRADKAAREREADKEREARDLENRNADADAAARDRLRNRGATGGEVKTNPSEN